MADFKRCDLCGAEYGPVQVGQEIRIAASGQTLFWGLYRPAPGVVFVYAPGAAADLCAMCISHLNAAIEHTVDLIATTVAAPAQTSS